MISDTIVHMTGDAISDALLVYLTIIIGIVDVFIDFA